MESQIVEAWDERDDWRGVASSKERRKRQNRLHQRAHRKKRLLKSVVRDQRDLPNLDSTCDNALVLPAQDPLDITVTLGVNHLQVVIERMKCTPVSEQVLSFLRSAYLNWSLGRPIPHDMPSVTRLNALNALMRNAAILQIPVEFLETDDFNSPFNLYGPVQNNLLSLPSDLCPTTCQRSVTHHSWLDIFPFPGLRDNILRGLEAGAYDEDYLCQELCCDLLNSEAEDVAGVVIWGDSWDAKGWEFSVKFFMKWGVLLLGCPEILEATNYWRGKRGLRRIDLPVS